MKKKLLCFVLMGLMSITLLYGCGENTAKENGLVESISGEEAVETQSVNYVGEYNDQDNNDPNLEIMQTEEGNFKVQIGIFRLITMSDGDAKLTDEGLEFAAEDLGDTLLKAVITLDGDKATVTFTDSDWDNIPVGTQYIYTKASDTPNMWED